MTHFRINQQAWHTQRQCESIYFHLKCRLSLITLLLSYKVRGHDVWQFFTMMNQPLPTGPESASPPRQFGCQGGKKKLRLCKMRFVPRSNNDGYIQRVWLVGTQDDLNMCLRKGRSWGTFFNPSLKVCGLNRIQNMTEELQTLKPDSAFLVEKIKEARKEWMK